MTEPENSGPSRERKKASERRGRGKQRGPLPSQRALFQYRGGGGGRRPQALCHSGQTKMTTVKRNDAGVSVMRKIFNENGMKALK